MTVLEIFYVLCIRWPCLCLKRYLVFWRLLAKNGLGDWIEEQFFPRIFEVHILQNKKRWKENFSINPFLISLMLYFMDKDRHLCFLSWKEAQKVISSFLGLFSSKKWSRTLELYQSTPCCLVIPSSFFYS